MTLEPLPPRNHRSQDEVAKFGGADDDAAERVRRDREQRGGLGRRPGRDGRLAGEDGDVADERPRSALREVARPFGPLVEDVDRPLLDDVEGGVALPLLEEHLPTCERELLREPAEMLDLTFVEAREEHGIVRIEEVVRARACAVLGQLPRLLEVAVVGASG